jgi:hypothetical protein
MEALYEALAILAATESGTLEHAMASADLALLRSRIATSQAK